MRRSETSPVLAMRAEVLDVQDLCPSLRRLTLGGHDLRHFGVGGPPLDLRFKLVVPDAGADADTVAESLASLRPEAPTDGDEHGWYRQWLGLPESQRGVMRTYTARAIREGERGTELDVDVVLHVHRRDGELVGGPATVWAANTRPGDTVTLVGPNRAVACGDHNGIEWRPGSARQVLLAGDETAVPAVASVLESLSDAVDADSWQGTALLEVPSASDRLDLATPPGITLRWLVRDGAPRGALLAAAVADAAPPSHRLATGAIEDVDVDHSILWEIGSPVTQQRYAWVAGEAGMLKQVRRWLLGPAGYDRDQVAIMGYWREGRAG